MAFSRTTRAAGTVILAVAVASVCARLGVWQLDRLFERRAYNALLFGRLSEAPVAVVALPADTGAGHYRRATASGTFDYAREFAWAARIRHESPGVNLMTPMRVPGSDTVVLVDRGWAYSPDAKSVQFPRWRERDTSTIAGYVETWSEPCGAQPGQALPPVCGDEAGRILRRLDRAAAERLVGAPVAPYVVLQMSDSTLHADSIPVRAEMPVLDEGPHLGYAYQWFAFAAIALAGGIGLARRTRASGV
jgi:surfeit locus 1 family protein